MTRNLFPVRTHKKKRRSLEHEAQAAVFKWANLSIQKYPELEMLFAIPNGGRRTNGFVLVAEGLKSGVPDIFFPVARQGFYGLFIEMKIRPNKPSIAQKKWLRDLTEQGYLTKICYSSDEAIALIEAYLC